jgi:hypothetical protein
LLRNRRAGRAGHNAHTKPAADTKAAAPYLRLGDILIIVNRHSGAIALTEPSRHHATSGFELLLDAHFIADAAHILDTARHLNGAVNLTLIVDETAELNVSFASHHGNV